MLSAKHKKHHDPSSVRSHSPSALREKSERIDVDGPYDPEVASVDGRDLGDTQPFGGAHDGSIDCAQWQVAVTSDQFSDPQPVRGRHRLDGECATSEVAQETDFGFRP